MKQIERRFQLKELFTDIKKVVAVEVGVAEGRFSLELLQMGIKKLYMVDVWGHHPELKGDGSSPQEWHNRNYQDAKDRVAPFKNKAVMLKGLSSDMAKQIKDNSIDLLYLDGSHDYEGVLKDLNTYFPKVKTGGIISGHDFLAPQYGVNQAVKEFCHKHNKELFTIPELKQEDAGFYFKK